MSTLGTTGCQETGIAEDAYISKGLSRINKCDRNWNTLFHVYLSNKYKYSALEASALVLECTFSLITEDIPVFHRRGSVELLRADQFNSRYSGHHFVLSYIIMHL